MLRTLTLLAFAATAHLLYAQCTDLPIPDNATVIDQSGTSSPMPGAVWICGGLDVTILGDYHNLYVEPNSTVQVIGMFCNGYMKGPGTLTTDCDTCFWQFDPEVDFVNTGGDMNFGLPCAPVTFNYADAPANGCTTGTGLTEHTAPAVQLELAPNPIIDRLLLRVTDDTIRQLEIVDLRGRTVLQPSAQRDGAYDVRTLRPGSYVARVHTDKGVRTATFNKQ